MSLALSRSKVELFLQCPRCFWLDVTAGVKQPQGFPFNLNSAVDHLLKNEFDRYRGGTTIPPRLAREDLSLIPAAHPELQRWRQLLSRRDLSNSRLARLSPIGRTVALQRWFEDAGCTQFED